MKKVVKTKFEKHLLKGEHEDHIEKELAAGFEKHIVTKTKKILPAQKDIQKHKKLNSQLVNLIAVIFGIKSFYAVIIFLSIMVNIEFFYIEGVFNLIGSILMLYSAYLISKYRRTGYFLSITASIMYLFSHPNLNDLLYPLFNFRTKINTVYIISLVIIIITSLYIEIQLFNKHKNSSKIKNTS